MPNIDQRPVVAPLDFDTIKADMIAYFQSKPEFKDYNFTGSALNMLMDILAYNTHYNSLAANFLVNEMFLDTAVLRDNVVSIAKSLNYIPRSARASSIRLTLAFTNRQTGNPLVIIPAGSQFVARGSPKSYYFYTTRDYVVQFRNDSENIDIVVYQGTPITQRFIVSSVNDDETFLSFDLPNNNIDTSTIAVTVNNNRYSAITAANEGILSTTANSRVFFVEETAGQRYRILFGNGVIGVRPQPGDSVIVTYLVTDGPEGNGISAIDPNINVNGFQNIVQVHGRSEGGALPETVREIKNNAPHWFQAQYRAVTAEDYKTLLRQTYTDIQAINVYGGETVGDPGKVFISIKPRTADVLSDVAKQTIARDILAKYNLVTVIPVIVDPQIIRIVPKSVVQYDPTLTLVDPTVIRAKIYSLFEQLNTTYIGDFLQTFYISNLSQAISDLDPSIVASNTRISLRFDTTITNGVSSHPNWTYGNRLYHPYDGYNENMGGILSTNLFYRQGRSFRSGFDDDGHGNVRLFDFIENQKVYVTANAGTINYVSGDITITERFDPMDGPINFTVVPESFDVLAVNNTLLYIASNDSTVYVLDKNDTTSIRALDSTRSA